MTKYTVIWGRDTDRFTIVRISGEYSKKGFEVDKVYKVLYSTYSLKETSSSVKMLDGMTLSDYKLYTEQELISKVVFR